MEEWKVLCIGHSTKLPILHLINGRSNLLCKHLHYFALNMMPPTVMSEDGEMLTLAEVNGEVVYLNEEQAVELAEVAYLQEGIYPDYSVQY